MEMELKENKQKIKLIRIFSYSPRKWIWRRKKSIFSVKWM